MELLQKTCHCYLSILAQRLWSERPCVNPLGSCPLDSLNDGTARVQGRMIIAAIRVEAVKKQSHTCRHGVQL